MATMTGRFVWFDLLTTDLGAARSFYTDIVGWKTTKWEGGEYEMWTAGEQAVGGMMSLSPEARQAGTAPHWLGFVATDDVDATVKHANELGGKTLYPPTDIPKVGKFAVLADPLGAEFAVFQPFKDEPVFDPRSLGHFGWAELNTTDWRAAWKFYSSLFNWRETGSMDLGSSFGEYFMFGIEPSRSMGGMSNAATMMNLAPHWLHYVNVTNADLAARKVAEKGGAVLNGPMDVPGGGRIAQCADPQRGLFAIYAP